MLQYGGHVARNQKKISSLPVYGVLVESHVHGPEFRTAVHKHPYHNLLYVVSGAGQCIIGQKDHELTANTAVLLRANEPHQLIDQPRKAMTVFVVYFDPGSAKVHRELIEPTLDRPRAVGIPPHRAQRIRRTLRQMLHEQDSKTAMFDLAMQQYLSFIMLNLYRTSIRKEKLVVTNTKADARSRVKTVMRYVDETYYEPQSLSNAARMAKLSQRQFSNICRKLKGLSFIKYVNKLRIQKAEELIRGTNMPVTAIAFEVGFEELSTFYRGFKRLNKVPPLAYREGRAR